MHVTLIGLGIMGSRMAKNLLKHEVNLTVYNRSPEPLEALKEAGATIATSYQDAVGEADVVLTMVSSPEVVEEIALADDGFIHAMKPQALWVDCSTVNPSFTERAKSIATAQQVRFVDAPVAGTKPQAEAGALVFFVGGASAEVEEITPLLNMMGQKIIHVGETGRGTAYKMLVNALLAQSMAMFAEAVLLGEKLGFSQEFLLDTLPNLAVSAPFTKAKAEMIRADDYEVQFPLELMYKDLQLVAVTSYEHDQPLYLANLTKELFAHAKQQGLGREDFAAIYKSLSQAS